MKVIENVGTKRLTGQMKTMIFCFNTCTFVFICPHAVMTTQGPIVSNIESKIKRKD